MQAWANGKWVPFKTVALENGRFSAGYRFMRTFSAQRYRFRAVIQDDPGFRVRGRAVEGGAGAGAAVGRYPAIRAARLSPTEALRSV